MRLLPVLAGAAHLLLVGACGGAESWVVYHAPDAEVPALRERAQKIVPHGTSLVFCSLPQQCVSRGDLDVQRSALEAGVCMLPCLVLQDAEGPFATLPLDGLSAHTVQSAVSLVGSPQRKSQAQARKLTANIYYYTACARLPFMSPQEQLAAVRVLQGLAVSDMLSIRQRQYIALRCLYPALMTCYARTYQGTHTPKTEYLFLQAISALELARDLDPLSPLGRRAHEARENLRSARLQAKRLD